MDDPQAASKIRQAGWVVVQDVSADRNISIIDWHGVHARLRCPQARRTRRALCARSAGAEIACRLEISAHASPSARCNCPTPAGR
jgi:hypothetical protein